MTTKKSKTLVQLDQSLVGAMSPIGYGTIFKAWAHKGSRGLDYIIVGIDPVNKTIHAIKHNTVRTDGGIHAAVRKHKRVFSYSLTPSGQCAIVQGITSILGQKANLDPVLVDKFNKKVNSNVTVTGFNTVQIYTQPLVDRRKSAVYN